MQYIWIRSLGQEDPLEKKMATHSSMLVWEILWTEEPGGVHAVLKNQTQLSNYTTTTTLPHTLHTCVVTLVVSNPMDHSLPGSSSMGFPRHEYWSGLPCPPPGDLPDSLQVDSLLLSHRGSPLHTVNKDFLSGILTSTWYNHTLSSLSIWETQKLYLILIYAWNWDFFFLPKVCVIFRVNPLSFLSMPGSPLCGITWKFIQLPRDISNNFLIHFPFPLASLIIYEFKWL